MSAGQSKADEIRTELSWAFTVLEGALKAKYDADATVADCRRKLAAALTSAVARAGSDNKDGAA